MEGRNERAIEIGIAYIHGRVEAQLEGFATSLGILPSELTARLATLLLFGSERQVSGNQDNLPALRRKTSKISKASRPVEMVGGSHRDKPHKRKKITHPYWSKLSAEERKAEMARRMKVRLAKKKAA